MTIDRYSKCVLTVIALCLVWMSVGGPSLLPTALAQSTTPRGETTVVITGWKDTNGVVWGLPSFRERPTGTFVSADEVKRFNEAVALGAKLPVSQ